MRIYNVRNIDKRAYSILQRWPGRQEGYVILNGIVILVTCQQLQLMFKVGNTYNVKSSNK